MRRLVKVAAGVAAVLLMLIAPIACVRWEQWQFRDAAGRPLMSTGGYRLIGLGPPSPEPDSPVATVSGHGAGWFGLFRFSVDGPYPRH